MGKQRGNILIVENNAEIKRWLKKILSEYNTVTTDSIEEAIKKIGREYQDVIIAGYEDGDESVDYLIKIKNQNSPETEIIFIGPQPEKSKLAKLLSLGIFDYITEPFTSVEVKMSVEKALENKKLKIDEEILKRFENKIWINGLVYCSRRMHEIVNLAEKVAKTDVDTILIEGETGVGKEVLARLIHKLSNKAKSPFIEINCAAIQETLLENELFGHEKGAFTDARETKYGLFEIAGNGTILLDEIGEMPLPLQAKLLRVIEDRSFIRVGGVKKIKTDARIIAVTNKNLKDEVKAGRFRSDLYYRLGVISFYIPPLRERKEDIPVLIEYFVNFYNKQFRKNIKRITKGAMEIFLDYSWPGNVRELRNVIERIVLLEESETISIKHIPLEMLLLEDNKSEGKISKNEPDLIESLEEVERKHIIKALKYTGGNKSKAAKILGIHRKTLLDKIKKYKIEI